LLVANLYRTWAESVQAFEYLLTYGNFPSVLHQSAARYGGAVAMYVVFFGSVDHTSVQIQSLTEIFICRYGLSHFKLNKRHGIVLPREELYAAMERWIDAVGDHAFLGQSVAPTMADLEVFGVLRAVEGYPVFLDLMEHSRLGGWYNRMVDAVGPTSMRSHV
jgi:microsomal prostaglandin-E synthase 2